MAGTTYKPRRRPGCLFIFSILFIAVVALILLSRFTSFSILPKSTDSTPKYGVDEFPVFKEIWSCGRGSNKVVRVPINGTITLSRKKSLLGGGNSALTALKSIRRATLDKDVLAIILEINSGGGGVTASDIIYNALLDFKKENPRRKVVAIYGDLAASGAFYISLAADHIIARPTSTTGSIGVIVPSINIHELAAKHGIMDTSVKSGANKDLLNPLAEPSEKQKQIMQTLVNTLYERFVKLVVQQRHISEDEVHSLADGSIFTAQEALRLRLIDEIGYWDAAITRTAELLNLSDIIVYRYEPQYSIRDLLRADKSLDLRALLQSSQEPLFQYHW